MVIIIIHSLYIQDVSEHGSAKVSVHLALSNIFIFAISRNSYSAIHLQKIVRYVIPWLCICPLHNNMPYDYQILQAFFNMPYRYQILQSLFLFVVMGPSNLNCHFLILRITVHFVFNFPKTSMLLTYSIHLNHGEPFGNTIFIIPQILIFEEIIQIPMSYPMADIT